MDRKIGVVTDTNACLDYFDHDYDIPILRSIIHLGEKEYLDHVELTADDFYRHLKSDPDLFPRTSQPPTAEMITTYRSMAEKGYTDIVFVTISQHMSGIHGAAMVAAKEVPEVDVHVFDSRSVAYPQAKMTLKAAELAEEGATVEKILDELAYIRENNHIYFGVDTLAYLVKNGRLTNAQGFMGRMLKIKPLLHISKEGKVENIEKIRTFKRAVNRVIEMYLAETKDMEVSPFICHAHNEETKNHIESVLKEHDPSIGNIFSMPLTPAVGAHSGPGAIGLGYIRKK